LSFLASESGAQPRSADVLPRPRIQTLSDLIFGLALSIGALTLLTSGPADLGSLFDSLIGFGWAFLLLALIWVRYTKLMSVLPAETGILLSANILLLFLVSVEPYLYSLIPVSFAAAPGQLDSGTTTAVYAIDMGCIFVVLAYFTHELAREEKKLVPKEMLRRYRLMRDTTVMSAACFFVSVLPIFWQVEVYGLQVRFLLWGATFVTIMARRGIENRWAKQAASP
jgi:uncharacterized membrane protein